jgi:hypothetical protein
LPAPFFLPVLSIIAIATTVTTIAFAAKAFLS